MSDRILGLFVGGPVRAVAWGAAILGAIGWLVSWWATLAIVAAIYGWLFWPVRWIPRRWMFGP